MHEEESVKSILVNQFRFSDNDILLLTIFVQELLKFNKKYNLISRSTEKQIWHRHILDSAQIINFIDFKSGLSVSDLGSGAGFPGLIIAIFNKNPNFHVKLYEKSPVKCEFLGKIIKKLKINALINNGSYLEHKIESEYIVCRAFKKLTQIMRISREIAKKPHKIIVLKGKSAQEEINKDLKEVRFDYKLVDSMTDNESKIMISDVIE